MKITLNWTPKVSVLPIAKHKMDLIVDICKEEVGWLGIVKQENRWEFLIEDVFLLKQEANMVTTELDPSDQQELWARLHAEGILTEAEQDTRGLYLWGHSHHNMGVSPSGQDEKQVQQFLQGRPPFLIRIIANKRGEYRTDLYMIDDGFTAEELVMTVREDLNDGLRGMLEAEIKEKVLPFRPAPPKTAGTQGTFGAFGAYDDSKTLWDENGDFSFHRSHGIDRMAPTPPSWPERSTYSFPQDTLEREAGEITRRRKIVEDFDRALTQKEVKK